MKVSWFVGGGTLALCLLFLALHGGSGEKAGAQATLSGPGSTESRQADRSSSIFKTLSAAEVRALMDRRGELVLIDVRTPQERKQMRIAGSQLVPVGDVMRGKLEVPPDQPIVLLCAVGGRSYIAGKALASRGYREIYNLGGGIEAWRREGLPLETGPE